MARASPGRALSAATVLVLSLAVLPSAIAHTTDICFGLNSNQKVEVQVFHWHGCRAATGYVDVTKTSGGNSETKRLNFAKHQCGKYRSHYQNIGYSCADTNNNGNYDDSFHGTVDFYCNAGDTFKVHAYSNPSWILVHNDNPTFSCPPGGIKEPNVAPTNIAMSSTSVPENSAAGVVVGLLTTTDANNYDKNQHTYSIRSGASNKFALTGSSVTVKSGANLNYEGTNSYSLGIRTTDLAGSTYDKTFTISVTNVNEAPTSLRIKMQDGTYPTSNGAASPQVREDAAAGLIGYLEGVDPDAGQSFSFQLTVNPGNRFAITNNNQFRLATTLNYETSSVDTVSIKVSDNGSPSKSATFTMAVRVIDVNEPPTNIALSNAAVSENVPIGTVVGSFSSSDPDAQDSFTYSLDQGGNYFAVSGANLVTKAEIDYEATKTIPIRARTTDSGGKFYTKAITISIGDVDEPPVASNLVTNLDEEAANGTLVGRVSASQPGKPNLALVFTISSSSPPADNAFYVQACSGNIYTNKVIDFETDPQRYQFVVDIKGDVAITANVDITINDINEVPEPASRSIGFAENQAKGVTVVASIPANDPDAGSNHAYDIVQGDDNNVFAIDSLTGKITVNNPAYLNFEARRNNDVSIPFELLVSVSDGGLVGYATITVTLTDVNEPPNFSDASISVPELSPVGTVINPVLTAFDEDGDNVVWSIAGGNTGNAFKLGSASGNSMPLVVNTASLDHEGSNGGQFALTIEVSDPGGNKRTATVTIFVTNVNEAPTFSSIPAFTTPENVASGTVIGRLAQYASDVDSGDTLSFTATSWTDAPLGSEINARAGLLVGSDGTLTIGTQPDFETSTSYTLEVRVNDAGGLFAEATITMTISNVNEAPNLESGVVRQVAENAAADTPVVAIASGAVVPFCATDPETSQSLTFSVSGAAPDNDHFKISPSNTADQTGRMWCNNLLVATGADYETHRKYTVQVTVTDSGGLSFTTPVVVEITDANDRPQLDAATFAVGENSVTGEEVGVPIIAHDQDATDSMTFAIVSGNTHDAFEIEKLSPIVGRLKVSANVATTLQALNTPQWQLTVQVTDSYLGGGLTATAVLTVTLAPENDPPDMSNTPTFKTIPENSDVNTAVFTAIATDPENDPVRFSIVSGNPTGAFTINAVSGVVTVAKNILNFESDLTSYLLSIETIDAPEDVSSALVSTKQVTVNVTNVNEAPTLDTPLALTIDENSPANTYLDDNGPYQGHDIDAGDSDSLKYYIIDGNDGEPFYLVDVSGRLFTSGVTLDFETKNRYTLTIQVKDTGGLTGTATQVITLLDVNESPHIADATRSVPENTAVDSAVGDIISVEDPDASQTFSWSIAGQGVFDIQQTGQIVLSAVPDFETKSKYEIQVTVLDQGDLASSATITVNIADVNEAPWFKSDSVTDKFINENAVQGTPLIAEDDRDSNNLQADDEDAGQKAQLRFSASTSQDAFAVDSRTGELSVHKASLDYETKDEYTLEVTVTDPGDLTATATVRIMIGDVNEHPVADFDGAVFEIEENVANGVVSTLQAHDPDAASRLTFSFVEPNEQFTLLPSGVVITKVALNYEAQKFHVFDVRVCDNGMPGNGDNLCVTGTVRVNVIDVNEPPVMEDAERSVDENSAKLQRVGIPIPASDVDEGQILIYEIVGGNDLGRFQIGACSGQVEVRKPELDFETLNVYTLQLKVTDDGDPRLSDTATLTIKINDVNEAPVITPTSLDVDENSNVDAPVGSAIQAFDQDANNKLSWSILEGDDFGAFKIAASNQDGTNGQVYIAKNIVNFESDLRVYRLTVQVSDDANPPLSATEVVTVTVNDVNERPVIHPGLRRSVHENSVGGVSVDGPVTSTDVDAGDVVKYAIVGGDGQSTFVINADTGAITVAQGASIDYETKNVYSVIVNGTDNGSPPLTGTTRVVIDVIDVNEYPSLIGAVSSVHVDENSPFGFAFGAHIVATDVDFGQQLTYRIVDGNVGDTFEIETLNVSKGVGQLMVRRAVLDFETPIDYSLTIEVADNLGLTDTTVVQVIVDNVNEAPVFVPKPEGVFIDENSAQDALVGTPLRSTDVDAADTRTYSIVTPSEEPGATAFSIDPTSGQIAVAVDGTAALDFEAHQTMSIVVKVTDAGGLSDTMTVTCQLWNVNEAPVLSNYAMSVPTRPDVSVAVYRVGTVAATDVDSPAGLGFVYNVTGQSDDGVFDITADGVLFVNIGIPVDTLVPARGVGNPFTVTVQVTDSAFCCDTVVAGDPQCCAGDSPLVAAATVTIDVTDSNNRPVLTQPATPFSVQENVASGTVVGEFGFEDRDVSAQQFTFSVKAPYSNVFTITQQPVIAQGESKPSDIIPSLVVTGDLDFEKQQNYFVTVGCKDNHAVSPMEAEEITIPVAIENVNEMPALAGGVVDLGVYEDAVGMDLVKAGYVAGTLSFVDPDESPALAAADVAFEQVSYELSVAAGVPLAIRAHDTLPYTAEVYVTASGINYEQTPSFAASVTVTDGPGLSSTVDGVIRVINRNDRPSIQNHTFSISELAPLFTEVGAVPGSDQDSGTMHYSFPNAEDRRHFRIDETTAIITVASEDIDYETQSEYVLTVAMTDAKVGNDQKIWTEYATVRITLLDENDITISSYSGDVVHATAGGSVVHIHGTNFGKKQPDSPTQLSARFKAADQTQWFEASSCSVSSPLDNTQVTCTAGPGVGADLQWEVTVIDGVNDFAHVSAPGVVTTYATPEISGVIDAVDMPTTGGTQVSISGINFGPPEFVGDLVVRYTSGAREYTATTYTIGAAGVQGTQVITAHSVVGVGADIRWYVSMRGLESRASSSPSSYMAPSVSAVEAEEPRLNTQGGQLVTVFGSNFGGDASPIYNEMIVTYTDGDVVYTAVNCHIVAEALHTAIQCASAPGTGANHKWYVSIGGQKSAMNAAAELSYRAPLITGVAGDGAQAAKTAGGQVLLISGKQLGAADNAVPEKIKVWYGPTATEFVAVNCFIAEDHDLVDCRTNEGSGTNHSWRMEIDGQWSPVFHANTGYANPVVRGFEGPGSDDGTTRGDESVVILGTNFGNSLRVTPERLQVTYNRKDGPVFEAADCFVSTNHTEVTCLTVPGAGDEHKWQLVVDGLNSTTPTTNYAPPEIHSIIGPGASSGSTYGGESVVLRGANFGPPDMQDFFLESVTYGKTGSEYRAECRVVSHEQLNCTTVPGFGQNLRWRVAIEGQVSDLSRATTSYAMPALLATTASSGNTQGGYEVTLTGTNLGFADKRSEVVVAVSGISGTSQFPTVYTPVEVIAGGEAGLDSHGKMMQRPDRVTFKFPEGQGTGKEIRLVVRERDNSTAAANVDAGFTLSRALHEVYPVVSPPLTFNYDPPTIFRVAVKERLVLVLSLDQFRRLASRYNISSAPEQMFAEYDRDGSKTLDKEEFDVLGEAHFNAVFEDATANVLSFAQYQRLYESTAHSSQPALQLVDGSQSGSEGFTDKQRQLFAEYDFDDSSSLNRTEFVHSTQGLVRYWFASAGPSLDTLRDVAVYGANFGAKPTATSYSNTYLWLRLQNDAGTFTGTKYVTQQPKGSPNAAGWTMWTHDIIHFTEFSSGTLWMELNSTDTTTGVVTPVETPSVSFAFFSPQLSGRVGEDGQPDDSPLRIVQESDGTFRSQRINVTGKYLFLSESPEIETHVTIGGTSSGVRCEVIERGPPGAQSSDEQYVTADCPPWQGSDVPVVVWKVFPAPASGIQLDPQGSQPFLLTYEVPQITNQRKTNGDIWSAPTNRAGGFNITFTGENMGSLGAEMVFPSWPFDQARAPGTNNVWSWSEHACVSSWSEITCQIPPGEGRYDFLSNTDLWSLRVRVPILRCANITDAQPAYDECIPTVIDGADGGAGAAELNRLSLPVPFRYDAPSVLDMVPAVATTGGLMTITGHNFGVGAPSAGAATFIEIKRGGVTKSCTLPQGGTWAPTHLADGTEQLTCRLPEGTGAGWSVHLTVAYVEGNTQIPGTVSFAYAAPVIGDLPEADAHGATTGGKVVTIAGSHFGKTSSLVRVGMWRWTPDMSLDPTNPWLGGNNTYAAVDVQETTLQFTIPPGYGHMVLRILVDGQPSNYIRFSYDAPTLQEIMPNVITTIGGRDNEMTLSGASLSAGNAMVQFFYPHITQTLTVTREGAPVTITDERPAKTINCTFTSTQCRVVRNTHSDVWVFPPAEMGEIFYMRVVVGVSERDPLAQASEWLEAAYRAPTLSAVLPAPANSNGDTLRLRGTGFGGSSVNNTVHVLVGGEECVDAKWLADSSFPDPYLECRLGRHVVGPKNVSVSVAFQTATFLPLKTTAETHCEYGHYGQEGEWCLPCPRGAECTGGKAEPVALAGWYNMNSSKAEGRCVEHRGHRDFCNDLLPCEPAWACIGANKCEVGYLSEAPHFRCSSCDQGYYRLAGECIECPDNPLFLIIGFFVGALFACIAGYVLNSKAVNLAFVSIGVDYFQILAIFRNSRVQWPQELKDLLHYMSVFNFNLDITAPECSIPDLGYVQKWFFIESLPLAVGSIFIVLYVLAYLKKKVLLGRKKGLHSHLPAMLGTSLVLFYYLYLYLTRTVLDVFNCSPTTPPDGNEYLEVVFEPCGLPGGVQMTLLPFAVIAFALYVVGYPLLVGIVLRKNAMLIMEDQLLRAKGKGGTRLENRNAYDVRKMYSKIFYQFKPAFYYWIMFVIARKFGIAFTALMFNKNPGFQLSMALLVIFISYALQVRNQPYMSSSEKAAVIDEHERLAAAGDAIHARLAANLGAINSKAKKKGRRFSWGGSGMVSNNVEFIGGYLFNLNTVAATLLFCSALVCLAGVMFESNRFEDDYFVAQKTALTFMVMAVIVFSIIYFCVVIGNEVWVTVCTKKPKSGKEIAQAKRQSQAVRQSEVQMRGLGRGAGARAMSSNPMQTVTKKEDVRMNPMFSSGGDEAAASMKELMSGDRAPDQAQWSLIRTQWEDSQAEVTELKRQLQQMQVSMRATGGLQAKVNRGRRGQGRRTKKTMVPTQARRMSQDTHGGAAAEASPFQ